MSPTDSKMRYGYRVPAPESVPGLGPDPGQTQDSGPCLTAKQASGQEQETGPVGLVYLLHFERPYPAGRCPQHYLGWTTDLETRLQEHRARRGGRLVAVVLEFGIDFNCARTWTGRRSLERKLKRRHGCRDLCPICRGEIRFDPFQNE